MAEHTPSAHSVTFASAGVLLSGTLSLPETDAPAAVVVMLAGSGETDRDGNAKQLAINLFPPIAETLTAKGFATFCYDKRGVGASEGDYWSTGFDDLLTDAVAAIEWLAQRPGVDPSRIFVLGHSEGALLSVRLAAGDTGVAGAVLLAGSSKTGEETLMWQGRRIADTITGLNRAIIRLLHLDVVKMQRKNIDRLKATTEDVTRIQLRKVNAKWVREFLAYDPVLDLSNVRVPLLAITGSDDIQVDPSDLQRMEELVPGEFESHVVSGVTHLLRQDPSQSGLKSYKAQAKQPVDSRVIGLVAEWLEKEAGQPRHGS